LNSGHIYSFEKLEAWQEARQLVIWIYKITKDFPVDEKFGLSMQLRRAAVSVVSNLAEGSGRNSMKDKAHFTQVAYSSLLEILNQLIIANDLQLINETILPEGRNKIEAITQKVAALRNAQLTKAAEAKR
jgi:four helix bundle protein